MNDEQIANRFINDYLKQLELAAHENMGHFYREFADGVTLPPDRVKRIHQRVQKEAQRMRMHYITKLNASGIDIPQE